MGTWAPTIMGGDTPMDIEAEVLQLAGLYHDDMDEYPDWAEDPATRPALEAITLDRWQAFIDEHGDEELRGVARQVVALMHITVGARLPEELRAQAIDACMTEDLSRWRYPDERQPCLDAFVQQLLGYDGTPTPVPQETLFDRLAAPLGPAAKPRTGP